MAMQQLAVKFEGEIAETEETDIRKVSFEAKGTTELTLEEVKAAIEKDLGLISTHGGNYYSLGSSEPTERTIIYDMSMDGQYALINVRVKKVSNPSEPNLVIDCSLSNPISQFKADVSNRIQQIVASLKKIPLEKPLRA